jgi:hypothetical protein
MNEERARQPALLRQHSGARQQGEGVLLQRHLHAQHVRAHALRARIRRILQRVEQIRWVVGPPRTPEDTLLARQQVKRGHHLVAEVQLAERHEGPGGGGLAWGHTHLGSLRTQAAVAPRALEKQREVRRHEATRPVLHARLHVELQQLLHLGQGVSGQQPVHTGAGVLRPALHIARHLGGQRWHGGEQQQGGDQKAHGARSLERSLLAVPSPSKRCDALPPPIDFPTHL